MQNPDGKSSMLSKEATRAITKMHLQSPDGKSNMLCNISHTNNNKNASAKPRWQEQHAK